MSRAAARASLVLLLAIWAGLVLGVSFLATPAKFLAPSLSMAVALDVGRHTFRILAWTELGIAAAALLLCWRSRANWILISGIAALWIIVFLEQLWLLPVLDHRVSLYLSGAPPGRSYHHSLYIAFGAMKVLVSLTCGARGVVELRSAASPRGDNKSGKAAHIAIER